LGFGGHLVQAVVIACMIVEVEAIMEPGINPNPSTVSRITPIIKRGRTMRSSRDCWEMGVRMRHTSDRVEKYDRKYGGMENDAASTAKRFCFLHTSVELPMACTHRVLNPAT
jgi:hypothetical protein